MDWQEGIDPRIKSFLKINELLFDPYNAMDLRKILSIRVEKALNGKMIEEDKYVEMIKSAPKQLQAALYSILSITRNGLK